MPTKDLLYLSCSFVVHALSLLLSLLLLYPSGLLWFLCHDWVWSIHWGEELDGQKRVPLHVRERIAEHLTKMEVAVSGFAWHDAERASPPQGLQLA